MSEGTGTGIRFTLSIPASDMTSTFSSDLSATATVSVKNSSVESGGSFNVYGNFGTVMLGIAMPSFSFPWGGSSSLAANVQNYKLDITTNFK